MTPPRQRMNFGIFMAPFHPVGQNPTLALERDLDLVEHLDRLGFDEAWIGEHHSAGYEIISSPEVFIAAAAARTKHIMLGTGVNSLPYHHPFMLADRMVLLDHLTRGRVLFGVGPGALPSDAFMMGIPIAEQRKRMAEALEAILHLLRTDEPLSMKTDWFEMVEARLQLRPYQHPCFEIAVAAQASPTGPRAAGTHGLSMLSIGATGTTGFDLLGPHWDLVEELSAANGHVADRDTWRLVGPMHLAPTREQAADEVKFGLADWDYYFNSIAALGLAPSADIEDRVKALNESGTGVIGTPADAIAQIERLQKQSGGFGTYLMLAHEWADTAATHRSFELFARYVMPHFQGQIERAQASMEYARVNRERFIGDVVAAIGPSVIEHQARYQAKHASDSPEAAN
jgi:limonene 1,2-monooxygenase